jgi:hypothetical protein
MSDHFSTGTEVAKRLTDRADAHDRMAAGSGAQHIGFYASFDAQLMRDAARRIEQLEAALVIIAEMSDYLKLAPEFGKLARAALAPEQYK